MLLYSTGTDPPKEKWDGASTRFPDVVALFGADDARPRESFADDLRALAARAEHVYIDVPERHRRQQQQQRRGGGSAGAALLGYLSRRHNPEGPPYLDAVPAAKRKPLAPLVGALRSVKSPCEVDVMKASAEISARAHAKVSEQFLWGRGVNIFFWLTDGRERRRCALLSLGSPKLTSTHTLSIYARGAVRSAPRTSPLSRLGRWLHFVSVCGCWSFFFESSVSLRENALVIHYTRNDHVLRDGELVLMDAGGEYKCAVSML